eukprot:scaffold50732_cov63-Cyclotella_meneghiniana.AAC.3
MMLSVLSGLIECLLCEFGCGFSEGRSGNARGRGFCCCQTRSTSINSKSTAMENKRNFHLHQRSCCCNTE